MMMVSRMELFPSTLATGMVTADSDSSEDVAVLHTFSLVFLPSYIYVRGLLDRIKSILLVGISSSTLMFFSSYVPAIILNGSSILALSRHLFSTSCLTNFGDKDGKGEGLEQFCHDHVNALGLIYTLLYGLFHHAIRGGSLKSPEWCKKISTGYQPLSVCGIHGLDLIRSYSISTLTTDLVLCLYVITSLG